MQGIRYRERGSGLSKQALKGLCCERNLTKSDDMEIGK